MHKKILGFSLVELAVVLLILTILLAGISVPLTAQVQLRRLDETRKLLETGKISLMGFVSTYGRFPCPATLTSNGRESFCTAATGACAVTTTLQSHGKCSNFYDGYLPAAALGITPADPTGLTRDAWDTDQNRIRYAVRNLTLTLGSDGVDAAFVFTATDRVKTATMAKIIGTGSSPRDLLSVCISGAAVTGFDCGVAANTLTTQAPAVLYSLGPNAATTNGTSTHEARNVDNNQVFVSRDYATSGADEFDDIVTWISVYAVFSRLIDVGKLP